MGTQLKDALRAAGIQSVGDRKQQVAQSVSPIGHVSDGGLTERHFKAAPIQKTWLANGPDRIPNTLTTKIGSGPVQITEFDGKRRLESGWLSDRAQRQPAELWPRLKPQHSLVKSGLFSPNDMFLPDPLEKTPLPYFSLEGIAASLTNEPDNETDLIIGLDFGTSATKVVVRDAYAATSVFPVQLNENRSGIESFLLPSRVYKTGNKYSLHHGTEKISDLKLSLLSCKASGPVTEFNDCCVFLALVIRRARAWLFTEHRDIYSRHALNWKLNLGIPARSYEDKAIVQLFRRLAWAAANLAGDSEAREITFEKATEWRIRSYEMAKWDKTDTHISVEFACNDVDVVPEVSAQLQGFMTAARWDWRSRPVMLLVDVGAGTVDTAIFHVKVPEGGHGQLTFYSSEVKQHGVINLHRARVASLDKMLPTGEEHQDAREYLESISQSSDRLRPIPECIDRYLPGYDGANVEIDRSFKFEQYRRQVAACINDAKVRKGISVRQLTKIPLLLCGGGSRMQFYGSIDTMINNTPGWHVSVEIMKLPVPRDLVESGWHGEEFDRLSVAYGLSLSGDGERTLGKIVRAIEVPNAENYRPKYPNDRYVSKDQV